MARTAAVKDYRVFTSGLISEATGLNYPENSARDLDNVNIDRSGAVTRRRGFDVKVDEPFWNGDTDTNNDALAVTTHLWENVANVGQITFVVVQVGRLLKVFDTATVPYTQLATFNLETALAYTAPTGTPNAGEGGGLQPLTRPLIGEQVQYAPLQSAVGRGRMWFTQESSIPFYLEYDLATATVSLLPVGANDKYPGGQLGIRDFNGVEDGFAVSEDVSPDTLLHTYNLYNQGWSNAQITEYKRENGGRSPSNAKVKYTYKGADDRYETNFAKNFDFGNSPAPRGRAIINPLSGDRDNIFQGGDYSTIDFSNAQDEPAELFFQTVEFFAGRLWLSGDVNTKRPSGVYFSQILSKEEDAGKFYQKNDPASEEFTDLLADDGGVLYINNAGRINKLVAFGEGMVVLSSRGVWFIRGDEGGFRATSYSVDKVSDAGCDSPLSVVRTDSGLLYWNPAGIYSITFDNLRPVVTNITDDRIQSFFQNIPDVCKQQAYGVFDSVERRVIWLYRDTETTDRQFFFNKSLILDLRIQAFYKYTLPLATTGGREYAVCSVIPFRANLLSNQNQDVVAGADNVVVGTDQVIVPELVNVATSSPVGIDYLILGNPSNTALPVTFAWADVFRTSFKDFQTIVTGGINYSSFLQTGDELLDDLSRNKQATYVHSFFNKTETAITAINPTVFDSPSGCTMQMRWDWHGSANGGRWSTPQQAYRFRRLIDNPAVGALDTGERIVYTKLKARGQGRAMAIRYESEEGKDFQLLGFSINATSNTIP